MTENQREDLHAMLKSIINDDTETASEHMHTYITSKTRDIAVLNQSTEE